MDMKLSTQQIGKSGELLVQYKLLKMGVESSPLTTDSGVDLVAYSPRKEKPLTIQVKTNLKPKPGGGKGKLTLDWWTPEDHKVDLYALVDLESEKIWLLTPKQLSKEAQQNPKGRYHIYMNLDPTLKPKKLDRKSFLFEFESYLIENVVHKYL